MNKSSKPAKWVCIRFVTSNFSTKGAAILCVHVFARERVRACTASCSIVKHVHTPIVGRRLCPSKLCVPYRRGRISTYGFPLARWRSPGHFYRVLFDHFLVLSFSFIALSFSLSFSLSLFAPALPSCQRAAWTGGSIEIRFPSRCVLAERGHSLVIRTKLDFGEIGRAEEHRNASDYLLAGLTRC